MPLEYQKILLVKEPEGQNGAIEGRGGQGGGGGGGGGGGIDFIFKVFLRPYISRIRIFAIEILLVGVIFVTILCPNHIFQVRRSKKVEIHDIKSCVGVFAYILSTFENLISLKF